MPHPPFSPPIRRYGGRGVKLSHAYSGNRASDSCSNDSDGHRANERFDSPSPEFRVPIPEYEYEYRCAEYEQELVLAEPVR